jgi:hypothetical protein
VQNSKSSARLGVVKTALKMSAPGELELAFGVCNLVSSDLDHKAAKDDQSQPAPGGGGNFLP